MPKTENTQSAKKWRGILEYTLVISNLKFFIFGGVNFGVNFGHLKSEVFHWGGISE